VSAERPAQIRAVCPFRLVVDEDAEQLGAETTMIDVEAGTTLFEEGDPTGGVAAILHGQVNVSTNGRTLATLGPGSVLGELSVFVPSAARTATALADTAVRLITWRADDVPARLARHERLATAVVADIAFVLAERLERRTQDVGTLLEVAGTRLPISELERFRSHAVQ
jgi:CRP-like cAMP-binding protein